MEKFQIDKKMPEYLIIEDYISLCLLVKEKVNLRYKSLKKIKEKHDHIMKSFETGKVIVPKNSIFNRLRALLPKEFIWIKTRKRLITEGEIQHNCVGAYAKRICLDQCAIYSLYYEEEKVFYTIEFIFFAKEDKYKVAQMRKANNAVATKKQ